MDVEFDPAKDAANLAKHGLSWADASDFDFTRAVVVEDDRFSYGETRYRAFSALGGQGRCLVFTVINRNRIRVISYRRARPKELKRYGL